MLAMVIELVLRTAISASDAPRLESIVPPHAATAGGATIRLQGAGFTENTRASFSRDGEAIELDCHLVGAALECVVPKGRAGPVDVAVRSPDGSRDTHVGGFTYFQILSVSPSSGPAEGGAAVAIGGRFFPRQTQILFGGSAAACRWKDASLIRCVTPPGPAGQRVHVDARASAEAPPSRLVRAYLYDEVIEAVGVRKQTRTWAPASDPEIVDSQILDLAWAPDPSTKKRHAWTPPSLARPPKELLFPQPILMPATPGSPRRATYFTGDPPPRRSVAPKLTARSTSMSSYDSIFSPSPSSNGSPNLSSGDAQTKSR